MSVADEIARVRAANDRLGLPVELPVWARILAADGNWEEAERVFVQALALTREMGYLYAEALALREYGAALRERGELDETRRRLREALTIFERLGARLHAGCVRRSLEETAR